MCSCSRVKVGSSPQKACSTSARLLSSVEATLFLYSTCCGPTPCLLLHNTWLRHTNIQYIRFPFQTDEREKLSVLKDTGLWQRMARVDLCWINDYSSAVHTADFCIHPPPSLSLFSPFSLHLNLFDHSLSQQCKKNNRLWHFNTRVTHSVVTQLCAFSQLYGAR